VTKYVLCGNILFFVLNLLFFLGNWETLTIVVILDIIMFLLLSILGGVMMYSVIFLLVIDIVVCIYIMYL